MSGYFAPESVETFPRNPHSGLDEGKNDSCVGKELRIDRAVFCLARCGSCIAKLEN
jgi:hypothetical protein